jgi:hypothetical protein
MLYFMNLEHGHLLTRAEMIQEFREEYDGGDDTNAVSWDEYYKEVELP